MGTSAGCVPLSDQSSWPQVQRGDGTSFSFENGSVVRVCYAQGGVSIAQLAPSVGVKGERGGGGVGGGGGGGVGRPGGHLIGCQVFLLPPPRKCFKYGTPEVSEAEMSGVFQTGRVFCSLGDLGLGSICSLALQLSQVCVWVVFFLWRSEVSRVVDPKVRLIGETESEREGEG